MLSSMTAFSRNESQGDWGSAIWEIRTVNHRYLDISFRFPEEFRGLEQQFREKISQYLSRGKVEANLKYQPGVGTRPEIKLNSEVLSALSKATTSVESEFSKIGSINPLHVLQWPGVVLESDLNMESISSPIIDCLDGALSELVSARQREGSAIAKMLDDRLKQMKEHVDSVQKRLPEINQQQRDKILAKINDIKVEPDNERLEQELVYYAQRIDVSEELDRLSTHIDEFHRIIGKGGAVGRRFDFLLQELNREANTLASKSVDTTQTHCAVEMKVLIEQLREQVQNLE